MTFVRAGWSADSAAPSEANAAMHPERRSMHWRLIWSVALGATISLPLRIVADDEQFETLFNGTTLDGWEGRPGFWSVKDGAIVGEATADHPSPGNTFLIWRQGTVDDFELRLEYRLGTHNSGIQYRSRDLGNFVVTGYQADFEAGTTFSGILYEERGRGALAQRGQRVAITPDGKRSAGKPIGSSSELLRAIKQGDWNEYRIIAQGTRLQHFINGQMMTEIIDEQTGKNAAEGVLALQLHGGAPMKVEFRNIRLKRL
jgi:hypothetical protein